MKETIIYLSVGFASLFILGYSIHMFVGGIVSPDTERWIITAAVAIGAVVLALMGWDIVRRRRAQQRH